VETEERVKFCARDPKNPDAPFAFGLNYLMHEKDERKIVPGDDDGKLRPIACEKQGDGIGSARPLKFPVLVSFHPLVEAGFPMPKKPAGAKLKVTSTSHIDGNFIEEGETGAWGVEFKKNYGYSDPRRLPPQYMGIVQKDGTCEIIGDKICEKYLNDL